MASVSARPADAGASNEGASNSGPASRHHAPAASFSPALRFLFPVTLVVLVFDQLTKIWAVDRLGDGDVIDLFWTARFNLVYNEGAAFSVGSQFTIFISITAIVISVGVIAFSRRVHQPSVLVAMGLVLGGALGNLIDRIVRDGNGFLRGAVVDFIDFQWWPVFNIADIAIVCGGILLVFLVSERSEKPMTAASESAQSNPGADSVGTVGADPTDTSL